MKICTDEQAIQQINRLFENDQELTYEELMEQNRSIIVGVGGRRLKDNKQVQDQI